MSADSTRPASVDSLREVSVYFPRENECDVHPFARRVPAGASLDVVRSTLQALLDGPTAAEIAAGYVSGIPDSLEVQRHRMRYVAFDYDAPHEGKRVVIESLKPRDDGILEVSFSRELNAYDRGATRVCAIIRQVQETVKQFPEWKGVSIAIEGKTTGILQP